MKKMNLIKTAVVVVLTIGLGGFLLTRKTETQTVEPAKTPPGKTVEGKSAVAGYQNWTKVNDQPYLMWSNVAMLCKAPTKNDYEFEKSVHANKYVNVYVNPVGRAEMLTKKNPKFPAGTVIVKEKLSSKESTEPELLTVMIKREKGFNPEVGDWEFMTLDGAAAEVTSKGKLESCRSCHLNHAANDYVTRRYLPENIRRKLK
jgi:hypothetical protein